MNFWFLLMLSCNVCAQSRFAATVRPLTGSLSLHPPPNPFVVEDIREWEFSTQDNAAVSIVCELHLPETFNCQDSSVTLIVGNEWKTACGSITLFSHYFQPSVKVLYRKNNLGIFFPFEPFSCLVQSKLMSVHGPVDVPPRSYVSLPHDIDRNLVAFGPPNRQTTCPCGRSNKPIEFQFGGRLIGADPIARYEFPFLAQIFNPSTNSPYCGGTIVSPHHILTAGHCVMDYISNGSTPSVLAGLHDTQDHTNPYIQVRRVSGIILHEFFDFRLEDKGGIYHDIALLYLADPLVFNFGVGPACLPGIGWNLEGQPVNIIGWGATAYDGLMTTTPQVVDLTVLDRLTCSYDWGHVSLISPQQFCTHAPGKSSCKGDSGGPVVWLDPETNSFTLVGIVSSGLACDYTKSAVQTDVSAHMDWIVRAMSVTDPNTIVCTKI